MDKNVADHANNILNVMKNNNATDKAHGMTIDMLFKKCNLPWGLLNKSVMQLLNEKKIARIEEGSSGYYYSISHP